MHYSEDDNADTPLLQATSPEPGLNTYSIRLKPWPKRHPRLIMALVAALSFSVALAVIARHGRKEIDPSALSHILTPNSTRIGPDIDEWLDRPNLDDPVVAARLSVDALFAEISNPSMNLLRMTHTSSNAGWTLHSIWYVSLFRRGPSHAPRH
jgi:hypothetical protein